MSVVVLIYIHNKIYTDDIFSCYSSSTCRD